MPRRRFHRHLTPLRLVAAVMVVVYLLAAAGTLIVVGS